MPRNWRAAIAHDIIAQLPPDPKEALFILDIVRETVEKLAVLQSRPCASAKARRKDNGTSRMRPR